MSTNRPLNKILLSLTLIIAGCLFARSLATAESLDDRTKKIAHKLRCPTCQAMSVKESDAGLSGNMKLKIRTMLEEGKSEEEILNFFEKRYGEWILRMPAKKGFNLLLWVLPAAVIAVAVTILFVSLMKRSVKANTKNLKPISEEENARVQEDLKNINL